MKQVIIALDGISESFEKYQIINKEKFQELINTDKSKIMDSRYLCNEGIIKDKGVLSIILTIENPTIWGVKVNGEEIINIDGYNELADDERLFLEPSLSDSIYNEENQEHEELDFEEQFNHILGCEDGKYIYYYSDSPYWGDEYGEDENMICCFNHSSWIPYDRFILLKFNIDDDEEFDINKFNLIYNQYTNYSNNKKCNNIYEILKPVYDNLDLYDNTGTVGVYVALPNKVLYDNKIIDCQLISWDFENYDKYYSPFILNKDISDFTAVNTKTEETVTSDHTDDACSSQANMCCDQKIIITVSKGTATLEGYRDLSIQLNEGENIISISDYPDLKYGFVFSHGENISSIDLSGFDSSEVHDMSEMFCDCKSLKELNLSNFNTSDVRCMSEMFARCESLECLDLSNFNTSHLKEMGEMFFGCKSLKYLNLSNFNTSSIEYMDDMFKGCSSLEEVCLEGCTEETKQAIRQALEDR